MITLQLCVILACLVIGTRFGGIGLGLISGFGIFTLTFGFGMQPGKPPVDVILTILAVISAASILQTAGGLNVLLQYAEHLLRRHPSYITILAPLTTWLLTILCGTGHVVYTMFPIIYDIAIKQGIRPERPMAVASIASQIGIAASPVSVAVVSMISIFAANGIEGIGILQLLSISVPATFIGIFVAGLWSMRRGKDLSIDPDFQARIADPEERKFIFGDTTSLLGKKLPKESYLATGIFFLAILIVVIFGAMPELRPIFSDSGKPLSMNLVIQMLMLMAGALILMTCKVKPTDISHSNIFQAGMIAIVSIYGIAWMADTFFSAHFTLLKTNLADFIVGHHWAYALVLFIVSQLVNSQAAAITAIAPMALHLGVEPKIIVAFFSACYGYFILPTYASDLACIGFDRSGTTKIGKFVINHSFIMPGIISVGTSCIIGYILAMLFL
ncbi:anaerobic C4-dicarboxylate transporter [Anaerosinus sp.]